MFQFKLVLVHVSPQNMNLTAIEVSHIQNRFDRGGFPRAIDPDKSHDIALLQLERNIFELKARVFLI
ncbi:hypothetical protein D3C81_1275680 [compost metagenome]